MKPFSITGGFWEKTHETVGLVCRPEYLRIVHAVCNSPGKPLLEPTDYYHLKDSLRLCTLHAISTLCNMHEGAEAECLAPDMLRILFSLLLQDVKNSVHQEYGKAHALWQKITDYLAESTAEEQTRGRLAEHFNVTETYISRLFSHFSGMTFKEYLRAERIKRAVKLLEETNMTIGEIAWDCGFQSSTYFIRAFRSHYDVSPGHWRHLKK